MIRTLKAVPEMAKVINIIYSSCILELAFKTTRLCSSDHPPSLPPNQNYILINSYSVSSDLLKIGPELTMDYPLGNPCDSSQRW